MDKEEIKKVVREGYAKIVKPESSCCAPVKSCCGGTDLAQDVSRNIGYTEEEMKAVPEGANLGLGCGNPIALASLKEGEVVLDLGSGAGFDCFLAANQVGKTGKVIGVDMTAEMLDRARENARKGNFQQYNIRDHQPPTRPECAEGFLENSFFIGGKIDHAIGDNSIHLIVAHG